MSRPFADGVDIVRSEDGRELSRRSVLVRRPFPGRASEMAAAYERQRVHWERTTREHAAALAGLQPGDSWEPAGRLQRRALAYKAATHGYLIAALLLEPAPPEPGTTPPEPLEDYYRRVYSWLEETGWLPSEAEALVALLLTQLRQAVSAAPDRATWELADFGQPPRGTSMEYSPALVSDSSETQQLPPAGGAPRGSPHAGNSSTVSS